MNLWASFKAFINDPLKFINDPANTTIEYQTQEAVKAGMSKAEVTDTLTKQGFIKGSPIRDIVNAVGSAAQFIVTNFHFIIIFAIGILFFIYVFPMFKKVK